MDDWESLTPKKIVAELDKYIVGQTQAKRAVALAMRNRWRRMHVDEPLRGEITPKNILMIGPTGVGKTEISRRLARLAQAPFVKVEATKFTEVGYVGRDVDSIVRDLVEVAVEDVREESLEDVREQAEAKAEERVLDALLPGSERDNPTREKFRRQFRNSELDKREIEIELSAAPPQMEMTAPPGMEEMTSQFQALLQNLSGDRRKKRKLRVIDAYDHCVEEESENLIDMNEIKDEAMDRVEENGIVFLDEIDKIAESGRDGGGPDISRHGVQRDLLPLIEGSTVSTRYGNVRTDHILFIASGAFQHSRPSDLIPELQGRLPLRVELSPLTVADFELILTGTDACLTRQYEALMAAEKVKLRFTPDGVRAVAETAWRINERTENIGARRLYTIMERLLEEVSFHAENHRAKPVVVNADFVAERMRGFAQDQDRARYVL